MGAYKNALIGFVETICNQMDGFTMLPAENQNELFDLIQDALLTNGRVVLVSDGREQVFNLADMEAIA